MIWSFLKYHNPKRFQDRFMSESPGVSSACLIFMVIEEKKKDQHKQSFRRVCQRLRVSPKEKCLL